MTKKQFVKRLMSQGIQRNEACKIAKTYNTQNISYASAYIDYFLKYSFKSIGETFRRFSEKLQEMAVCINALKEGLKNDGQRNYKSIE